LDLVDGKGDKFRMVSDKFCSIAGVDEEDSMVSDWRLAVLQTMKKVCFFREIG